jgi:hypothetical protein
MVLILFRTTRYHNPNIINAIPASFIHTDSIVNPHQGKRTDKNMKINYIFTGKEWKQGLIILNQERERNQKKMFGAIKRVFALAIFFKQGRKKDMNINRKSIVL